MQANRLAVELLVEAGIEPLPALVAELTDAISRCNGGVRITKSAGLLILGNVFNATPRSNPNHIPVVAQVKAPPTPRRRQCLRTSDVAAWFQRCAVSHYNARPSGWTQSWAPVATQSLAPVAMGGRPEKIKGTTNDPNYPANVYYWYDLGETPLGGVVWRVTADRFLVAFQRVTSNRANDLWVRVSLSPSRVHDVVNVTELVEGPQQVNPIYTNPRALIWPARVVQQVMA